MDIQYASVDGVRSEYDAVAAVGHMLRFADELDIL